VTSAVLVVDDHPSALAGLAYALRDRWEVLVAATVAEALAVLARLTPAAVVLDLLLDADASPLHRELVLRAVPVVAVSGIEASAAESIARVWGWRCIAKPPGDLALTAAVAAALETAPMPDDATQRATMAPPAPDAPLPAPPAAPDGDSVSPLAATHPQVAVAEAWSRTIRRSIATLAVTGLALYFESRGHVVPLPIVAALTVLGIGVSGALAALRKRPAVAAGGAGALAVVALGGTLLDEGGVSLLATLGAGAIPLVDLLADRVRS
jgi:CheY-like chemotaxis protein